jgi:hypothetical protein
MPFTYRVDRTQQVVWITLEGRCGIGEIRAGIEHVWTDPDAEAVRRFVWDLRDAQLIVTGEDLRSLLSWNRPHASKRPPNRAAVVATAPAMYGVARMAEAYADVLNSVTTMRVFRDMDEALDWLGVGMGNQATA